MFAIKNETSRQKSNNGLLVRLNCSKPTAKSEAKGLNTREAIQTNLKSQST